MIATTNINLARKQIMQCEPPIIVLAQDDVFNRKMLEYGKFQILLSPEAGKRKNTLKKIDCGINHVMSKIAAQQSVAIGFDVRAIAQLPPKEKGERLAKIQAIITVCKKTNTKLALTGTRDKRVVNHFLLSLGASTSQASKAILF